MVLDGFNPADFGTSPILETMRKMAYDRMPVKLGQKLFSIFFNDDMRAWSVRYEPVTGVCFDGFRVSSSPARLPSDSSVLFDWDTIGKEVFLTTEEATREALRRTREGIRP